VGWLPATITFLVISAWSTASALFLTRLIQRLPGNAGFGHRIEFGKVAQVLLPRWAYLAVVLVLCATFICQNISNIIVSAQSVDDALMASVGTSCALAIYPQPGGNPFFCIHSDNDQIIADSPFNGRVFIQPSSPSLTATLLTPSLPLSNARLQDTLSPSALQSLLL
jgi:hypothetical protein